MQSPNPWRLQHHTIKNPDFVFNATKNRNLHTKPTSEVCETVPENRQKNLEGQNMSKPHRSINPEDKGHRALKSLVHRTCTLSIVAGALVAMTGCSSPPPPAEPVAEKGQQAQPTPSKAKAKGDSEKTDPTDDKAQPAKATKPVADGPLQITFEGKPVTIATAIATRPFNSQHVTIVELYEKPSTCARRTHGEGLSIKMPVADLIINGKTPGKGFSKLNWQGATVIKDNGSMWSKSGEQSYMEHDYVSVIKAFETNDKTLKMTVKGFKAKPNSDKADFEHVLTIDGEIEATFCPPAPKDQVAQTRGSSLKATVEGTEIEFQHARLITDTFGDQKLLLSVNPLPCSADPSYLDDVLLQILFTDDGKPKFAQLEGHRLFGASSLNHPDDFEMTLNTQKMSLELSSDHGSTLKIKKSKIAVTDCRQKKGK